jgi:hypothetical protein
MKKIALLAGIILSACVIDPRSSESQQDIASPHDATPIVCSGSGCNDPRCVDLAYECTVYAEYPDDSGCHVTALNGADIPNGDIVQCLCTGVLSEDTYCTLSGFSS